MPSQGLTWEEADEAVRLFRAFGTLEKARHYVKQRNGKMGIGHSAMRKRIKNARQMGLQVEPAAAFFNDKRETDKVGGDFRLEASRQIGKVTTHVTKDGVTQEWIRHDNKDLPPEVIREIFEEVFEGWEPVAPKVRPARGDDNTLVVYVICDWHIGLFAWGQETDSADWDLKIARRELPMCFEELVESTPAAANALVLILGDIIHADSPKNMTPTSGNLQDVDTRYGKVLPVATEILLDCLHMVSRKHKNVEVTIKEGNHDIASTVGLRTALGLFYRGNDRVSIDPSPSPFYWKRFGVNLIGGTHGHTVKVKELPLIMANIRSEDWAACNSKHCHTGHQHHEFTFEHHGVKIFQHRAPVPVDAWHAAQGYLSGRSMRAFLYHNSLGARGTVEVEIL